MRALQALLGVCFGGRRWSILLSRLQPGHQDYALRGQIHVLLQVLLYMPPQKLPASAAHNVGLGLLRSVAAARTHRGQLWSALLGCNASTNWLIMCEAHECACRQKSSPWTRRRTGSAAQWLRADLSLSWGICRSRPQMPVLCICIEKMPAEHPSACPQRAVILRLTCVHGGLEHVWQ